MLDWTFGADITSQSLLFLHIHAVHQPIKKSKHRLKQVLFHVVTHGKPVNAVVYISSRTINGTILESVTESDAFSLKSLFLPHFTLNLTNSQF